MTNSKAIAKPGAECTQLQKCLTFLLPHLSAPKMPKRQHACWKPWSLLKPGHLSHDIVKHPSMPQ